MYVPEAETYSSTNMIMHGNSNVNAWFVSLRKTCADKTVKQRRNNNNADINNNRVAAEPNAKVAWVRGPMAGQTQKW